MDTSLVERWLHVDPVRWVAGAFAGLTAGLVALGFAMLVSSAAGVELWFPAKLMASILVGPAATQFGTNMSVIFTGLIFFEIITTILGVLYAHFAFTNHLPSLLSVGLVWGTFSWIFIWNLFMHSFKTIFAAEVPSAPVFFICLVYGLALTSVAFFDRAMRGNSR